MPFASAGSVAVFSCKYRLFFGALPVHAKIKMALTSIQDDLQKNAGTPNSIKNCR
jgi:hypothetical protein